MAPTVLKLEEVSFTYGDLPVIEKVSLSVEAGEIVAIMGPSGCGKSTLLRLIAGLERSTEGRVVFGDHDETTDFLRFLFQDYDAFPWFTVYENVRYSARRDRLPSPERVEFILREVGLWEYRDQYPRELSGGMRKRLALARCLAPGARMLLLDEPFAALDVDTKQDMYELLQKLWQEFEQTILMVTHDVHEAVFLASRVVVATSRPFRIRNEIEVPFPYPRRPHLSHRPEIVALQAEVRKYFKK